MLRYRRSHALIASAAVFSGCATANSNAQPDSAEVCYGVCSATIENYLDSN